MATRIKLRRDTSTRWENINPILSLGEPGLETDTGKIKYGNGITTWNLLPYFDDQTMDLGSIDQHIIPDVDNTYDLGSPTKQWRELYVSGGSIYLGNIKLTNESGKLIATKVINPGQGNEAPDPVDPDAGSDIGGGGSGDRLVNGDSEIVLGSNGDLTLPSGSTIRDIAALGNSLMVLGAGDEIAENQRAARVGLNGELESVGIGAGTFDWTFTNNGKLNLPAHVIDEMEPENNIYTGIEFGDGTVQTTAFNLDEHGNFYTGNFLASGAGLTGYGGSVYVRASRPDDATVDFIFRENGQFELPAGGDIVDYNGNSVLGGGTPSIPNTKKGFINLVGDRPNDEDDAWFETVAVGGSYAYVAGGDYYIDNNNNLTKVYKFNLETGEQVWVKKIVAGRDAQFTIDIVDGVPSVTNIAVAGVDYKVGEELPIRGWQIGGSEPVNDILLVVDAIDGSGGVNAVSIKPGYNLTGINSSNVVGHQNNNARGDVNCIAHLPTANKLVVVREHESNRGNTFDSYWQWSDIHVLNAETGEVESTKTLQEDGDVYVNSIRVAPNGTNYAVVGEKYNEYREFGTLTMAVKANGYFDILKSNLDPEHYPGAPFNNSSDFWITGTGISSMENVDQVNYYPNLPTTTREGSGATFDITVTTPGSAYVPVTVATAGTNYRVGHKIKVLGTDLEGTTPANDLIITVTSVDAGGGITGISTVGDSNASATMMVYTRSGSNYQVGSGALISIYVDATTGAFIYGGYNNGGSNYVIGDVLTISGTNFAGGTSPANNATLVVNSVSGSGEIQGIVNGEVSGNAPSNILRLNVDGVDFTAVGGSWSMKQNLGGEAFVWTPTWSNAIGGPSGDRFYDVCWNDDGSALYAVGRGRYETNYDQALVVMFNGATGDVVWSKDIKFSEAAIENREARAVVEVPNSTDIMVAGVWYNNNIGQSEIILTRMTNAGTNVWQKTYSFDNGYWFNWEINLRAVNEDIILSLNQGTNNNSGLGYLQIDPADGTVIRHRVLSSDGNSNYTYYDTPTANFADVYSSDGKDYQVMAGYTYVPTDNYYNALLVKMPLDGYKNIQVEERLNIGEHILSRHDINVTTVTPAFDSFTPDEHVDTFTIVNDLRDYKTLDPDGYLQVWTYNITDDSAGYLEFGDGSRQSFATDKIPQIPAANDYYLTEQDSGKHIFFEHENGWVYIVNPELRQYPVGFTFTVVNTTGSDCFVETLSGISTPRARLKLAGRNIDTVTIGIPDSGSGSMVTFLKIKDGYVMENSDGPGEYPDVWIVSGPGDVYDND